MKKVIFVLALLQLSFLANAQTGWVLQNSNINKSLSDVFFINSQTGWITSDSSRILRTSDGGTTWTIQTLPLYSPMRTVFFINENTGWAAGGYWYFTHTGVVAKTTNGGINWVAGNSGSVTDIYYINGNTGFISTDNSGDFVSGGIVFKTTNAGSGWQSVQTYSERFIINSITSSGSTLWGCGSCWDDTGHDTTIILKSTDNGDTWHKKYAEPILYWYNNLKQVYSIGVNVWAVGKDSVLLKSSDDGENWENITINNSRRLNTIYFTNSNTGWIAGSLNPNNTTIMKTTNGGINWFNLNNIYTSEINSLSFVNENTGWAAGNNGLILKTTTGGLTLIKNSGTDIPQNFVLSQNFPNPFNPVTKIKFDLAKSSFVKLSVFDIQGKLVKTIVEGELTTGSYNTEWDATEAASGIYVFKLEAGEFVSTKRMMLVK